MKADVFGTQVDADVNQKYGFDLGTVLTDLQLTVQPAGL